MSFRQRLCPPALLGRMNASVRFIVFGTMPLGGLLGGVARQLARRRAHACGSPPAGSALAALPVALSPLIGMRELPDELDATRPAATGWHPEPPGRAPRSADRGGP